MLPAVFVLHSCSEQLVVDSENTVLAVANLWVTRGQGKGSTDHQVLQPMCGSYSSVCSSFLSVWVAQGQSKCLMYPKHTGALVWANT
eukprot:598970-Pelagomonas_calceolata.AAC.4